MTLRDISNDVVAVIRKIIVKKMGLKTKGLKFKKKLLHWMSAVLKYFCFSALAS